MASKSRNLSRFPSQLFNVQSNGADPLGVANSTPAFSAATGLFRVTDGVYKLDTLPAFTGSLMIAADDATFTGANASSTGFVNGPMRQEHHFNTTQNDFASRYLRRNVNHSGGTAGIVANAFRADTYVPAGVDNFEWTMTALMDTSGSGENVAMYGICRTRTAAAPGWGGVFEVEDYGGANPTGNKLGIEIDNTGNGTDNNNVRVGVDVAIRNRDPAGADIVAAWGVRIQNGGSANALVKVAYGFFSGMKATVGFDTSDAIIGTAAFRMASGQAFALNAGSTRTISYDGNGFTWTVAGAVQARLTDTGGITLNTTRFGILGTWATGAAIPTLGTNKPGTTGAPILWADVTVDGTAYTIPMWSKA